MLGNTSDLPDNVSTMEGRKRPAVRVITKTQPGAPGRARQRYRYFRRHTPHYYLVLSGISLALLVCLLNTWAFLSKSVPLSEVAFGAVAVTALVISTAFFWGFFMVMNGNIPAHRIRVFIPHGIVGCLSPLCYALNVSLDLEDLGVRPVSGLALACSVLCVGLLGIQFAMGKGVVHTEPIRLLRPEG
ncbi:MAG: hypothetical protein M3Z66_06640 [Chloroflexota bacterium]|nr:hypothetical protein [Chloroflexota bacterium]